MTMKEFYSAETEACILGETIVCFGRVRAFITPLADIANPSSFKPLCYTDYLSSYSLDKHQKYNC